MVHFSGLSYNQLPGLIPASLGNLTNLQVLTFDNNLFSGSIPDSLGKLTNLQTLSLKSNQLTGIISTSLRKIPSLSLLYFFKYFIKDKWMEIN